MGLRDERLPGRPGTFNLREEVARETRLASRWRLEGLLEITRLIEDFIDVLWVVKAWRPSWIEG